MFITKQKVVLQISRQTVFCCSGRGRCSWQTYQI